MTGEDAPDVMEEKVEEEKEEDSRFILLRHPGTQRDAVFSLVNEIVQLHSNDSNKHKPAVSKETLGKKATFNKVRAETHYVSLHQRKHTHPIRLSRLARTAPSRT